MILAQGGRFGGWSLWLQDGRPRFTYNWFGTSFTGTIQKVTIEVQRIAGADRAAIGESAIVWLDRRAAFE